MAGSYRVPLTTIPFENTMGATVLCDDGSVWELLLKPDGQVEWNDLKSPLPGSAAANGWTPAKGSR